MDKKLEIFVKVIGKERKASAVKICEEFYNIHLFLFVEYLVFLEIKSTIIDLVINALEFRYGQIHAWKFDLR